MKYVWVVANKVDLGYGIESLHEKLTSVPYSLKPCFEYEWQGNDKPLIKGIQLEDRFDTDNPDIFVFKQEVK